MSLLTEKNGTRFYDAWESQPEEKRVAFQRAALDAYVRYARESTAYYPEVLAAYDPKAEHPLAKVPVLTSSELRKLVPPFGDAIVAVKDTDYTVFQSGGTTGVPKTTLFSHHELERLNLPNARGFYAVGLQPTDRAANLFAVGSLYMTFVHINRMLQQYGCMNFPFSNNSQPDFVHTVTKLMKINVFTGIASVVMDCLRAIHQAEPGGIKIEKIFYGGEHLYDADKLELKEKFGTEIIAAPGYGTVDTWYIGYQCSQTATGVFHAHDDEAYLEIVNEESGEHCKPGEVGMLYATAFPRQVMPIVRYRVGDRAKWMGEPCPCGRTTPTFHLLGRGDDVLRVGYDSVDYNAIQKTVMKVSGLSGTIQMVKSREESRDRLTLRIETEAPEAQFPAMRERLEREILDSRPAFRQLIQNNSIWPLVVELLRPGTIQRNPRTGKLIRVVDQVTGN